MRLAFIAISILLYLSAGPASSQVAGSTLVAFAVAKDVAIGWSAKRQILGQPLYNESWEKVGTIIDIIVTPDAAVSYAIVGAGGFVGLGKHDVALPVSVFREQDGKFVLDGATKDAIKALPAFEYANSQ